MYRNGCIFIYLNKSETCIECKKKISIGSLCIHFFKGRGTIRAFNSHCCVDCAKKFQEEEAKVKCFCNLTYRSIFKGSSIYKVSTQCKTNNFFLIKQAFDDFLLQERNYERVDHTLLEKIRKTKERKKEKQFEKDNPTEKNFDKIIAKIAKEFKAKINDEYMYLCGNHSFAIKLSKKEFISPFRFISMTLYSKTDRSYQRKLYESQKILGYITDEYEERPDDNRWLKREEVENIEYVNEMCRKIKDISELKRFVDYVDNHRCKYMLWDFKQEKINKIMENKGINTGKAFFHYFLSFLFKDCKEEKDMTIFLLDSNSVIRILAEYYRELLAKKEI